MEYIREDWKAYSERLKSYDYTDEEISNVRVIREDAEQIPNDMFDELVRQGVIKRTRKLKKKRSLYVLQDGKIYYAEHWNKRMEWCGYFKDEEDGEL
jgi:hypothetical protein